MWFNRPCGHLSSPPTPARTVCDQRKCILLIPRCAFPPRSPACGKLRNTVDVLSAGSICTSRGGVVAAAMLWLRWLSLCAVLERWMLSVAPISEVSDKEPTSTLTWRAALCAERQQLAMNVITSEANVLPSRENVLPKQWKSYGPWGFVTVCYWDKGKRIPIIGKALQQKTRENAK